MIGVQAFNKLCSTHYLKSHMVKTFPRELRNSMLCISSSLTFLLPLKSLQSIKHYKYQQLVPWLKERSGGSLTLDLISNRQGCQSCFWGIQIFGYIYPDTYQRPFHSLGTVSHIQYLNNWYRNVLEKAQFKCYASNHNLKDKTLKSAL